MKPLTDFLRRSGFEKELYRFLEVQARIFNARSLARIDNPPPPPPISFKMLFFASLPRFCLRAPDSTTAILPAEAVLRKDHDIPYRRVKNLSYAAQTTRILARGPDRRDLDGE